MPLKQTMATERKSKNKLFRTMEIHHGLTL